jgi:hypothetical protein
MKRGWAVLRRGSLTLGLLMALGGSAWANGACQCTLSAPPVTCTTVDFDGVLIGNTALLTVVVTSPAGGATTAVAGISGPNTIEFSIVSPPCGALPAASGCSVTVAFTPLGCSTRNATLTVTFVTAGAEPTACSVMIPLRGFGCSFDCAIDATQTATGLTATARTRILQELILAQATTGSVRCAHLECALCLAQPELLRGRQGADNVVAQILCLLVAFCSPTPTPGV